MSDDELSLTMPLYAHMDKGPFVYYIQCGSFVKIGTSIDPASRVKQLRLGGKAKRPTVWEGNPILLGVEFGNAFHERQLHHRFAEYRDQGEWFTLSPELSAHIDEVQSAQTLQELALARYPSFDEMSVETRVKEFRALTLQKPVTHRNLEGAAA